MIIRILLLSVLAAIGWFVFLKRTRLPVHIVLVFGLLGLAAIAVVFPTATQVVANFVGVGRGADLVFYLVDIGLVFVALHYYTKFVELQRQITQLVREIAILRAELGGTPPAGGASAPTD